MSAKAGETKEERGKTKDQGGAFPPQYDPHSFEDRIYALWENAGVFRSTPHGTRKPYTIVIPPPNVTGVLHIGHALNNTLQDVLVRWRRMQGFETLWQPGADHAGIATQNVIEKHIAKTEKKSRYQLGREELVRRCWEWQNRYGDTILRQLRKLGCSCDWKRTRYTNDPGLSKAVRVAFVRLYDDGLIYRGKYLVNWCPRCRTTLSDEEVEHADVKDKLYEIHYPFSGGPGRLTVATTRPETMLGDTAVAVHPKDERYKKYVGQFLELPLTGRKIPVIADPALELGFGTGCLKVTPAHDPVDYQIAQRHKLPLINILTESGALNENVPPQYRGLDRFKARTKVLEDLQAQGLLGQTADYSHQVGHCYRCNTMIEPYLAAQWFVKMKSLTAAAVKATRENRVNFHPERWTKVYLKWFEEARDWPISRQIWWGHQLPVWYDLDANKEHISAIAAGPDEPFDMEQDGKRIRHIIGEGAIPIVLLQDPETLPEYKGKRLLRDPDVLDTWFSSALWPFSTLGWPEKTQDLEFYYPTSTLVTAREIIYFWVARMVMMGERMMGREPFRDVYIHGTVLDEQGRIMSKSLGNGLDPLEVIKQYGADALRFTLTTMCTEGQDLKISLKRFEMGRNFANKVWNACRFVLTNVQGGTAPLTLPSPPGGEGWGEGATDCAKRLRDEDRWILSRLNSTISAVTAALEAFEFSKAIGALYDFFWNEFCSWYIELSKPRLAPGAEAADRSTAQTVLLHTLDRSLRLLQPFCPYVSEALWAQLQACSSLGARSFHPLEYEKGGSRQDDKGLLATAAWPQAEQAFVNAELEAQFASIFEAVVAVRAVRQQLIDNSPKERKKDVSAALAQPLRVVIATNPEASGLAARLQGQKHILMRMANIEAPEIGPGAQAPQPASATAIKGGTIYVALTPDLLDVEKKRLSKEIENLERYIPKMEDKLRNESFVKNAPQELVTEEQDKLREARAKVQSLKLALFQVSGF